MGKWQVADWITALLCLVGVSVVTNSYLLQGEGLPSTLFVVLFGIALAPYAICFLVSRSRRGSAYFGAWGAGASLLVDWLTYHSVFVAPQSSTAALGLLFAPLVNVLFVMPGGMLCGLALRHVRKKLIAAP